jgi:TolB-like protein
LGYIGSGIVDDITTELTRYRALFVISRDSTIAYRAGREDISAACQRLGVRHALMGSLRRAAGKYRVNLRLVDGATGQNLWSERYDVDREDFMDLPDEIINTLVSNIATWLDDDALARARRKPVIARHYGAIAPDGLAAACSLADIHFDTPQFGLIINFEQPTLLAVHDRDMVLDHSIRALVAQFGAVIFRNAAIAGAGREKYHRNIVPHLKFHVDRGPTSANQYSCFTRDPDDPVQRHPRLSSTTFVTNIVAWLEMVRTGRANAKTERGIRVSYELFQEGRAAKLFGKVILEQPWEAPEGIGEIAVIDNRTVLHATYDKRKRQRGYPIGARYLI